MARLPRLALPGELHLVLLRGLAQRDVVVDDEDRRLLLAALHEASRQHALAVHGYAVLPDQVRLLASPSQPLSLAKTVQDFGRRYVAGFNRRHGQRGTLWDGRYRCCVVQPGPWALSALMFVEGGVAQAAGRTGMGLGLGLGPDLDLALAQGPGAPSTWTSTDHHLGVRRDPLVSPLLAYWQLGNTPFDREATYARQLSDGLPAALQARLAEACQKLACRRRGLSRSIGQAA
jgi:putative transposase